MPFDIQGLLAAADRNARRQGLLGAGIGLLSQGPSPYPIPFLSSVGRGLAGYQLGSQTGYDQEMDRGFGAMRLGLLSDEMDMKRSELDRKAAADERAWGFMEPFLGGKPGLLNAPSPPSAPMPMPGGHSSTMGPIPSDQGLPPGVDRSLINGIVRRESNGDPMARGAAGEGGLMQLMPGTAADLGVKDPFDPAQNLTGGVTYLKQQLDRFGDLPTALAAYNAGPARVAGGTIPASTKQYVQDVQQYATDPSTPDYWGQYMQTPEGQAEVGDAVEQATSGMPPGQRQTMQQWLEEDPARAAAFGAKFIKGASELGGAGAGVAEALGWAYETMQKEGRFGPPTTDPILGPGQYDLRSGEFKSKGGTSVTVQNYPEAKGEVKWAEKRAERADKFLQDQAAAFDRAISKRSTVEAMRLAADQYRAAGGETGAFAPIIADTTAFVQGLGIDPTSLGLPADAGPAQVINALTSELALGKIGADAGGMPANNFSEADRDFIVRIVSRLGDTPTGFAMKLEIQDRMNGRALEAQALWDEGVQSGKYPNNPEGVEAFQRDLRAFVLQRPLFTAEEKAALQTAAKAGAAPAAQQERGVPRLRWDGGDELIPVP